MTTTKTVTYEFTIRPAWAEHCPPGWSALRPADPPTVGHYGHVDYPAPLPRERADRCGLRPVTGDRISAVIVDGDDEHPLLGVVDRTDPHVLDVIYDIACGTRPRIDLDELLRQTATDYGVALSWRSTASSE